MRPHRANDAVPRLVETLFLCGALFLPGCSGRVVSPDSYVAAEAGTIDAAALRARTTPALVIRALASSFNRRDPQRYAELFTGDYQFVFAA